MKASWSPGRTVNGKFYCDVLMRKMENIRHKFPESWRNKSCAMHHDNDPAYASLVVRKLLPNTNGTVIPTLTTQWTSPPVNFFCSRDENKAHVETFWQYWVNPEQIAGGDEDSDRKFLPAVLPILEIPLESLYQCRWGLLQRGWKRIENSIVSEVAVEEFLEGNKM